MSVSPSHWLGLQGRVVAVTGAASGIGAATARQIADNVTFEGYLAQNPA